MAAVRPGLQPGPAREVAKGALGWLHRHQERFDPLAPTQRHFRMGMKIYGELVLVLINLVRNPRWRAEPSVQDLAGFAGRIRDRCRLTEGGPWDPFGLTGLAMVEEFTRLTTGRPSALSGLIRRRLEAGLDRASDWMPAHLMELRYRLDRIGVQAGPPPLAELYRRTALGLQLPLAGAMNGSLYSITHTIFYLTDMGHRPVAAVIPEGIGHLADRMPAMLGMAVRMKDLDLTAELLMCWAYLGMEDSLLTQTAWALLRQRMLEDGAVPGPMFSLPLWQQLSPDEAAVYRFEQCYHSTVAALAAAAAWCGDGGRGSAGGGTGG